MSSEMCIGDGQTTCRTEKVNDLLRQHHAPIITIGTAKEIRLDSKARREPEGLLQEVNQSSQYYTNKKERQIYMYLTLLMNSEYLSLSDFTDSLGVNRNTVLLDLKELTQMLEERGVRVGNNRTKGYYLVGSEMGICRMMMKYVIYTPAKEQNAKIFDVFIDDFNLDIFGYSRLVITKFVQRHNIRLMENRLVESIYISIFLRAHMQDRKNAGEEIHALLDMEAISSMKEHKFMVELLKNYKNADNITNTDINYTFSWILGTSSGDINEETRDCILISDIVGKIMTRFEHLSGAHYRNTEGIFIQLCFHFRPVYYRLLCRLSVSNPLCDRVGEEYRELYQPAEETTKPFHVTSGGDTPAGKIAYLTMHFASIYSDQKTFEIAKQKTAPVVCFNEVGSSTILHDELIGTFPELRFLSPLETPHIRDIKEHADIIFSTSYVSLRADIHVPVTQVDSVMSIAERYQVIREVYMQMGSHFLKRLNVDIVIGTAMKYADIREEHALYSELITYSFHIDTTTQEECILHLADMIEPELIRLHLDADNWEEAVRKAYEPAVQRGYVIRNYMEETISSVQIVGPYTVITECVALPHAKPEAGALSVALRVGILNSAIKFSNRDNDPVKYVFSSSATSNQTYLYAMAKLLEMSNRQELSDMLDQAKNSDGVMVYLKENQQ